MEDRFKLRVWVKSLGQMFMVSNIDYLLREVEVCDPKNGKIEGCAKKYGFDDVILMQCTGLKDKNGVLIFEKNIIRAYDAFGNRGKRIVAVEYARSYAAFYCADGGYSDDWLMNFSDIEIIGDVHQNPELLEGE